MIKAVIFDLDGTVTDTLSTIAHFGNYALNVHGFPSIPEEEFKYFAGDGKRVLLHRMLSHINADTEENFNMVEKTYDNAYESDPIGKTTPFPGMVELMNELHKKNIKTAVNTNKPHNVAIMILEKLFPKGSFDKVYGQIEGLPLKPDPTLALKIAKELDVSPEECLFVGDTSVDMLTANSAGMKAVGVLWGFRPEAELKDTGAHYIISHTHEILNLI